MASHPHGRCRSSSPTSPLPLFSSSFLLPFNLSFPFNFSSPFGFIFHLFYLLLVLSFPPALSFHPIYLSRLTFAFVSALFSSPILFSFFVVSYPPLDCSSGLYFHLVYLCFISFRLYPSSFFHCLINSISYFSVYIFPSNFLCLIFPSRFISSTGFPWAVLPVPIFPLNFTCEVASHTTSIGVFIRLSAPSCLGPFSLFSCQGTPSSFLCAGCLLFETLSGILQPVLYRLFIICR